MVPSSESKSATKSRVRSTRHAAIAQAVHNVNYLPEPTFPGASQIPPVQQTGPRPRPRNTTRES